MQERVTFQTSQALNTQGHTLEILEIIPSTKKNFTEVLERKRIREDALKDSKT